MALYILGELAADRPWPASIAAGLAPLARPELILLSLPALVLIEWRMVQRGARRLACLALLAPLLACTGGWMLYCLIVTGYPLPSTFYAKFSGQPEFFNHNLVLLFGQMLPSWPWFGRGAGLVLWAIGAVVLLRRSLAGKLVAAFPVIYLLAIAGSRFMREASPFYWQRYFLPALAFILPCVIIGGMQVLAWAWQGRHQSWAPARALLAMLLVVGTLVGLPPAWKKTADLYAWNCQNIEELNVAMAVWLRNNTVAGEMIAVTDAGAARYFSDRPIFDMIGLNNHRFLHRNREAPPALHGVRLVSVFPAFLPFLRDNPSWRPVHRVATGHLTICDCPQSEIVAYRRVGGEREGLVPRSP
jgi:hypothetical protein